MRCVWGSDFARFERCYELHQLLGWTPESFTYYDEQGQMRELVLGTSKFGCTPVYFTGFLLRKLSEFGWCAVTAGETTYGYRSSTGDSKATFVEPATGRHYEATDDTPPDALCKLSVELAKQGVLTP